MPRSFNSLPPVVTDDGAAEDDLYLDRVTPKTDLRSKLIRSKERAAGMVVNACPFGCKSHQLDAEGYCKHMVGTTEQGDAAEIRVYFPMVWREDAKKPGQLSTRYRFTDGSNPKPLQAGDRLVRVTTCYRVYRQNYELEVPSLDPITLEAPELVAPNDNFTFTPPGQAAPVPRTTDYAAVANDEDLLPAHELTKATTGSGSEPRAALIVP